MWTLWLLACASPKQPETDLSALTVQILDVDDHPVQAELARTREERHKGLMFRKHLGPNDGMLFLYNEEKPRSFWMKDTPLPLSAAYLDAKGVIVNIVDMPPFSTDSYPSLYPAQYVLEMNQGWFEENGVARGDIVKNIPKVDVEP